MKVRIVTALFDIKREKLGDGRKIEDYLIWLKKTLQLKCEMTIYTEEKFKDFIIQNRKNDYKTDIIIQDFTETPFYINNNKIKDILKSDYFKSTMKDLNRIECYLSEYNVIQYSKFGWLKDTVEKNNNSDYFIWMDAGCSRFFNDFDLSNEWPNKNKLEINKLTIQGNSNFVKMFETLNVDDYMWINDCILVGTIFGGGRDIINKLYYDINDIFNYYLYHNCVNNEQFALAVFAKKNIDLMNIIIHLDGTHLPLFKILSQ